MDTTDLVIETAVTAVGGQTFDDRVQHLDTAPAAGHLQPAHVGHGDVPHRREEIAVALVDLGVAEALVRAAVGTRRVVLHIDKQQRRVVGVDLDLAAQSGIHPRISRSRASAAESRRARRAAQAAWPAASAIRSWRISISTWARPRRSACTGTV